MTDVQVYSRLRSMGMTCFVKHFHKFADKSLSHHDIIQLLLKSEPYTPDSCATRTSKARTIIESGGTKTALRFIIQAHKLPHEIRQQAATILNELP